MESLHNKISKATSLCPTCIAFQNVTFSKSRRNTTSMRVNKRYIICTFLPPGWGANTIRQMLHIHCNIALADPISLLDNYWAVKSMLWFQGMQVLLWPLMVHRAPTKSQYCTSKLDNRFFFSRTGSYCIYKFDMTECHSKSSDGRCVQVHKPLQTP